MNKIKAIFISSFIGLGVIVIILAIIQFFQGRLGLAWMGALLTGFLIVEFFANLFRFKTARTPARLPMLTGLLIVTTAVSLVRFQWLPSLLSLLLFAGWLAYVYWYSRLERGNNDQLVAGRPFPSIILEDEAGNEVSSANFSGQTTLYLFYRGNWCPLCMAQIKEVAAEYQLLAQQGVRVVLISPQPHKFTRNLAARFEVPFTFLVDVENKAARQLGIQHENGVPAGMALLGYASDTVLPTVLIVGKDGRILYTDLTDSYRIRPEPSEFLRVLGEPPTTN
ncbi:MAG: redoxin family protein [Chloroflexi bacterium]|nr:redoxin family protein [Chloroflexota bacterium]